ncbi:ferritin [Candidatus Woesearchaeota archaeon CG1_02_57_44]|nr:MAG: ferritin [Candidatus Woesearchaeota archaeon CG1_02_57_44]PIN67791.1 MAG: ferritin [Candidatus Woesearchaeota archaeon CG11_big_fil_rev_8_21_14_0_20_57_5]
MELTERMHGALNDQVTAELHAAHLYLAMAADFEAQNLTGMAAWMKTQAQEELAHAMRIYDYINTRDSKVTLKSLDAPPADFGGPIGAFKAALEHEKKVTGMIHRLVALAREEKDLATESFLQWYVNEQVEEESTAQAIIEKIELVGDKGTALYLLDKELGARGGGKSG